MEDVEGWIERKQVEGVRGKVDDGRCRISEGNPNRQPSLTLKPGNNLVSVTTTVNRSGAMIDLIYGRTRFVVFGIWELVDGCVDFCVGSMCMFVVLNWLTNECAVEFEKPAV